MAARAERLRGLRAQGPEALAAYLNESVDTRRREVARLIARAPEAGEPSRRARALLSRYAEAAAMFLDPHASPEPVRASILGELLSRWLDGLDRESPSHAARVDWAMRQAAWEQLGEVEIRLRRLVPALVSDSEALGAEGEVAQAAAVLAIADFCSRDVSGLATADAHERLVSERGAAVEAVHSLVDLHSES